MTNEDREYHKAPDGALAVTPSAHNLAISLKEMLDCYWGDGDGNEPPHFILQAQLLVKNYERDKANLLLENG